MTISARIIADSIGEHSPRLTTLRLRYPKFIHGEFMTHRVFSRNASSSRAIPVERLIKDVIEDPVYPSHWGANQKGMRAEEELNEKIYNSLGRDYSQHWTREQVWDEARRRAVEIANIFEVAGYHKQIVNRLLEPFCHINVVVTATEWSNFFALRCHPAAQPEMRLLAEAIRDAMAASEPEKLRLGSWHLPYIFGPGLEPIETFDTQVLIKLSVARCARVSYLTQEGKTPSVEEDLALYERLAGSVPLHASPMEHQATPDQFLGRPRLAGNEFTASGHASYDKTWYHPEQHGNLRGWVQYRKTLPGECQ